MKRIVGQAAHMVGFAVVILAVFFIISGLPKTVETNTTAAEKTATTTEAERQAALLAMRKAEYFGELELEAGAVYVFDVRDGVDLFYRQADESLPLASLTKLMTALVASEYAPSSTTTITMTQDALDQSGDHGLFLQEQWQLDDLLDIALVASSNDAAYAIASGITPFITKEGTDVSEEDTFVAAMNDRARSLNLSQTHFLTSTGLDLNNDTEPSAFGSARDMTRLFAHILKHNPQLIEATKESAITRFSLTHGVHNIENTNGLADRVPFLIGGKTGYTDQAGGNLILAFDVGPAHPIIVTVLGSTLEGRFTDMNKLVLATKSYFGYDSN